METGKGERLEKRKEREGQKNLSRRVFVAVDFPSEVVKEVARIQGFLGKKMFTGKMTELENLHLTLKFLGELDEERLEEVRKALEKVSFEEFEGVLDRVGTFSYRGKPRIVWLKIGGGSGIRRLQMEIDGMLGEIGFEKEERFMSHLTIARVKHVKDARRFRDFVLGLGVKKLKFGVGEFKLKESELKKMGPEYTTLETYMGK
jgi:RNA 2',3'-cyclic 3'-phosphodiesterase